MEELRTQFERCEEASRSGFVASTSFQKSIALFLVHSRLQGP
jgi:hypothetical protein